MFAVIKTGGKQHKVAVADQVTVMALEGAAGDKVSFEHVLGLVDGETVQIGAPYLTGVTVVGEIVRQARGPKVIAFKKRRRKNSRRKRGHRQDLTLVKIVEILTGGAKPKAEAKPAKAAAPVESDAPAEAAAAPAKPRAPKRAKPASE
ncbi:MAG: 50S ribosomal protein L21 [Hyphomicrobiales bacterium]|nr:50S ribosomal protein L21 [Hyphomicrobiales bacterium]MDE2018011.1 50S ribosomal protein L21 [Hyphomicrobiales bacterium]